MNVPVVTDLHRKVFEAASIPGHLEMGAWHTCDTTHCRAGWVVHLANAQALEARFGTLIAAMMIYDASCPGYEINPCRFYDSNDAALADMRRLAEAS